MDDATGPAGRRVWGGLLLLAGFGLSLAAIVLSEKGHDVPPFFLFPVATGLAITGGVVFSSTRRLRNRPPTPAVARVNDGLALLGIAEGFGAMGAGGIAGYLVGERAECSFVSDGCDGIFLAGITWVMALALGMTGAGMIARGQGEMIEQPRPRRPR